MSFGRLSEIGDCVILDGLVREEAGNDCVKIVGSRSHTCKCRSALEVGCTGEV
jgi:hypothetical protein